MMAISLSFVCSNIGASVRLIAAGMLLRRQA